MLRGTQRRLETRLGAFEVVTLIGAGSMCEVYNVRDIRPGRTIAVKILPSHVVNDSQFRRISVRFVQPLGRDLREPDFRDVRPPEDSFATRDP